MAMLVQLAASAVAVALLVGLAALAGRPRPTPPLDPAAARDLLASEFPGRRIDGVWIAARGDGVVARSGDLALILYRAGDGYVARSIPWRDALAARTDRGRVRFRLGDPAAPSARLALRDAEVWPPMELTA